MCEARARGNKDDKTTRTIGKYVVSIEGTFKARSTGDFVRYVHCCLHGLKLSFSGGDFSLSPLSC